MTPPDVSVVIPTYRREREVVEAVRSALGQERVSVEVLVLDDTAEATARAAVEGIGDARVRYLARAKPSGGRPAVVRNEGMGLARGRYLYFLDDDDRAAPGAFSAMVSALDARPSRGVAFGGVQAFGPDAAIVERYNRWWGWTVRVARRARWSWLAVGIILFRGTLIINSTCMIRRECALALDGYDADIPVYEDVEFFMRGIRSFGHVFVEVPVLLYSTGQPSMIHDLKGDNRLVVESHGIINRMYREQHGWLEFRLLQVISKLLPIGNPPKT